MIVAAEAVRRVPVTGLPMAEMSTQVPAASASAPAAPMMMKVVVAEVMKAVPEARSEAGPETMATETTAESLRDGVDVSHCQRE
jgi:hypothetical protein